MNIFALVEDVLSVRECRHPTAVAKDGIPAGMVEMQVCAEDVSDALETQARGTKIIEPRLLGEVKWGWITFVIAEARIDQHGKLRRAYEERLESQDHSAADRIEYNGVELSQVPPPDLRIIGQEHILWRAPRAFSLDEASDGHVTDLERFHMIASIEISGPLCLSVYIQRDRVTRGVQLVKARSQS